MVWSAARSFVVEGSLTNVSLLKYSVVNYIFLWMFTFLPYLIVIKGTNNYLYSYVYYWFSVDIATSFSSNLWLSDLVT